MKIYLVDFENVKSKGLEGIDRLSETDNVIIFFSENSDTLSFEMHQKVLSSKADIEYFKVSVGGKNALDFQLSTLLGYMVAKEIYTHIFVISNDKGFDFLHSFWSAKYIDTPKTFVGRAKTIKSAIEYEENKEQIEQQRLNEAIAEIEMTFELADQELSQTQENVQESAEKAAKVKKQSVKVRKKSNSKGKKMFDEMFMELLDGSCDKDSYGNVKELFVQSQTKEEFHNSLAKTYKQQGSDIYKAVKSKYLKLKEKFEQENPDASAAYPKTVKGSDKLAELLSGMCEPDDIDKVRKCFDSTQSKRDLYISMVKEFHKKKGCEYYNAIKPHYSELSKKA